MSTFLPLTAWGPATFSSGAANPKAVQGPKRTSYVQEHEIPGREGGIVEYLGSKQPTYRLQGFLAPVNDTFNGTALGVLSGTVYIGLNADDAVKYLNGLRGSGAQLLRVESTWSNFSGYSVLYENDFFYATSMNFALEAGRGYPYYPYTIDLMRASTKTYGSASGGSSFPTGGAYFSGFAHFNAVIPKGESVAGVGLFVNTVSSGNLRMGILSTAYQLLAESAAQPVTSGWNYFPLNPTLKSTSGTTYVLGFMGDATTSSGYSVQMQDTASTSGNSYRSSGAIFNSGFTSLLTVNANVSGITETMVFVTG